MVASIILIAVTVAVSIAVAAWMGALTFNFMSTEQGHIVEISFTANDITVKVNNIGTSNIVITQVFVNGADETANVSPAIPVTLTANEQTILTITIPITNGYQYEVQMLTSKGNKFVTTGTAVF